MILKLHLLTYMYSHDVWRFVYFVFKQINLKHLLFIISD